MSRYIDADEIKRQWEIYGSFDVMDRILANVFPTVDAVPVVRCKDCKHNSKNGGTGTCDHICIDANNRWFCADGERVSE